ncbi:M20 family metallo-hydrolase [Desulfovibrio sp. OttesenSCG-928-I05]|nr:M20 family metallo-hydrolase [Desulfovibrio sp. OttesenSCG-928-I05]
MDMQELTANIRKALEALHPFNATPGNGTTRLPFTREARGAVEHLKAYMAEAGLAVREDEAGNVIGVLEGEDSSLPALVMGSHYDTVINGGNFDGQAGIVAGVEIARLFRANRVSLKRNFVVIAFCDEEGMRFSTGYFGSRSWMGEVDEAYLHTFKDKDGISVFEAMKSYGLDPAALPNARWDMNDVRAFIELHIEQGPVLDAENIEVGLVDCIVGIRRYMVTVSGRPDHAGTTPMDMRMDAVEAASKVFSKIPDWARARGDGSVATTGFLKVTPGGINIVPEEVQFSIDIRSRNRESLLELTDRIKKELDITTKANGTSWKMEEKLTVEPLHLSPAMLDIMEESCTTRGYSYRRMVSGAGHDALAIGQHVETVMVFTPSKNGRSHCPVEWTEYSDVAKATSVIYDLVIGMQ